MDFLFIPFIVVLFYYLFFYTIFVPLSYQMYKSGYFVPRIKTESKHVRLKYTCVDYDRNKKGEITEMTKAKQPIKKICEYCGKEFLAWRTSSRYCSHTCNSRAYKAERRKKAVELSEGLTLQKKEDAVKISLSDRPYLSISEAAQLLGVCRQTVYNLAHAEKIKATRISQRLSFISRKSIDELLEVKTPYELLPKQPPKPITDWYTIQEITQKYGIKYGQIRKIIMVEQIPTRKDGKFTLIAKNRVDAYFKKQGYNESIDNLTDWLTFSEVVTQYRMTQNTAYSFLSENKIPKKRRDGQRYYSKWHIDKCKA